VGRTLKSEISIPLILTGVFTAFSFIPVIQILILTFDGGLIALANKVVRSDNTGSMAIANIIVNLLPTLLLLFVYFRTIKQSTKIIAAFLGMIFMTVFIFFLTGGIDEDNNPYFLNFLIIALISGSVLTLISLLRYRRNKTRAD